MAVEDGAALGTLLGLLWRTSLPATNNPKSKIRAMLKLYEEIRKGRTTFNVQGANRAKEFFHMEDGPEQEARDVMLKNIDWRDPSTQQSKWGGWSSFEELKKPVKNDTVAEAEERFRAWEADELKELTSGKARAS